MKKPTKTRSKNPSPRRRRQREILRFAEIEGKTVEFVEVDMNFEFPALKSASRTRRLCICFWALPASAWSPSTRPGRRATNASSRLGRRSEATGDQMYLWTRKTAAPEPVGLKLF